MTMNERVVAWTTLTMGGETGLDGSREGNGGFSLFSIKDDIPEPGTVYDKAWESSAWRPRCPTPWSWGAHMAPDEPDFTIVF